MNALEIAAIGLQQDQERLKLISHNLANLSTPGYKRQVMASTGFAQLVEQGRAATLAAPVLSTALDLQPGRLLASAEPLDLALPARQFLVLEREDGSTVLSADGRLHVDAKGMLRHASGLRVQGQGGALQVPVDAQPISIDAQGRVLAGTRLVDSLRLVQLPEGTAATALGQGLLDVPASAWQVVAAPQGLRSAQLEASNVVAAQEMVQMMSTTRHAETMVRLAQLSDEMLEKAIRRFGE